MAPNGTYMSCNCPDFLRRSSPPVVEDEKLKPFENDNMKAAFILAREMKMTHDTTSADVNAFHDKTMKEMFSTRFHRCIAKCLRFYYCYYYFNFVCGFFL
jgi:hypothetical protein